MEIYVGLSSQQRWTRPESRLRAYLGPAFTRVDVGVSNFKISRFSILITFVVINISSPLSPSHFPRKMQCSEGDRYPIIAAPPLSMSELICKTYEDNVASALLDAWFKRHHKQFSDWFEKLRGGHEIPHRQRGQLLAWNTGEFAPENIFCRTVDTARVIPLDRTWTTHIYYHKIWRDHEQHLLKLLLSMVRRNAIIRLEANIL